MSIADEEHLAPRDLDDLWAGRLEAGAARRLLGHLLRGCRECAQRLRPWVLPSDLGVGEGGPGDGRGVSREWLWRESARAAAEDAEGRRVTAELVAQPPERRRMVARESRWVATPSVVRRLEELARDELSSRVGEAQELAALGVEIADRLSPARYGEALVRDVQARARVELSRAQRRAGELRTASATLARAEELLAQGTGDPLELGALLEAKGLLAGNRRRFADAQACFQRALGIYRRLGEAHRAGRTLVSQGIAHAQAGDVEAAIRCLERSAALVDTAIEPRWALAIYHNLAGCQVEAGRLDEALALLDDAEDVYRRLGRPADLLKLRWTEGQILLRLGRREAAAEAFGAARDGFEELDLPYEAACVSLELAMVYLEVGAVDRLKELCLEMIPVFESRQVGREALAAFALFRRAVEREAASTDLVRKVADALRRRRVEA